MALNADGNTLLANADGNAIAVMDLNLSGPAPRSILHSRRQLSRLNLPAHGNDLFIGGVIGYYGGLQKVALPAADDAREAMTRKAKDGFHFAEIVRAQAAAVKASARGPCRLIWASHRRSSTWFTSSRKNKKYDQVLGDIGRGNSDPRLCEFRRSLTPNAHAAQPTSSCSWTITIATACVPATDHQWAVQGINSTSSRERLGECSLHLRLRRRSLCYARGGFIWDHLLRQGVSFRNFGELDYPVNARQQLERFLSVLEKGGQQAISTANIILIPCAL